MNLNWPQNAKNPMSDPPPTLFSKMLHLSLVPGREGEGVLPCTGYILGMCCPKGYGFFSCFGHK